MSLGLWEALTDLAPIKMSKLRSQNEVGGSFMSALPRGFFTKHWIVGNMSKGATSALNWFQNVLPLNETYCYTGISEYVSCERTVTFLVCQ